MNAGSQVSDQSHHLRGVLPELADEDDVARVLRVIRSHLRMDVAFVSQFVDGRRVFRHVDTQEGSSPIGVGDSNPLEEGYCQRVVDGRLPELIPDTAQVPAAMEVAATRTLPVGAHLSVPIRLSDGSVYGTLCCFSYHADPSLNDRDLQMFRAFAELTSHQIERSLKNTSEFEERRSRISTTISEEQYSIVYQPIFDLLSMEVRGLESLSRFSAAPSRSPDVWFAEAATVDQSVSLELATMRTALVALPRVPKDVYLAINLSPPTILSSEFGAAVDGLPLEKILLEITEHESISTYNELSEVLERLRFAGLRIAVDDAGAGYASMRHVLNLKPDLIKLDMSLTRDIDSDPARRALASALVGFARETGCGIIAEGVETPEELEVLRQLGVTKAQGYLLGRPMPFASVAELFPTRRSERQSCH